MFEMRRPFREKRNASAALRLKAQSAVDGKMSILLRELPERLLESAYMQMCQKVLGQSLQEREPHQLLPRRPVKRQ